MTENISPELVRTVLENGSGIIPQQLQPLTEIIVYATQMATAVLGGIIGLYIFSFIVRWYHDRKIIKELRALRKDIEELKSNKYGKKNKKSKSENE